MKKIGIILMIGSWIILLTAVIRERQDSKFALKTVGEMTVKNLELSGNYQKAIESMERMQLDAFIASQNSNRMQANLDTLKSHAELMVMWGFRTLEYTGDRSDYLLKRMPPYPGLQPMLQVTNWGVLQNIYIYIR